MRLVELVALNRRPTKPAPRRVGRLLRQGPQAHPQPRKTSLQLRPASATPDQSTPQRCCQGLATRRLRPAGTSAQLKSP